MENKDSKSKRPERTVKEKRGYIDEALKTAAHPVRGTILKALRDSDKTIAELEPLTGENRYNLYFHLSKLEKQHLIEWKMQDNKTKIYHLRSVTHPEVAVVPLNCDEIRRKPQDFDALIDAISALDGQEVPYRDKIVKAEICLYYSWADED
jgi:hypothetical protein